MFGKRVKLVCAVLAAAVTLVALSHLPVARAQNGPAKSVFAYGPFHLSPAVDGHLSVFNNCAGPMGYRIAVTATSNLASIFDEQGTLPSWKERMVEVQVPVGTDAIAVVSTTCQGGGQPKPLTSLFLCDSSTDTPLTYVQWVNES